MPKPRADRGDFSLRAALLASFALASGCSLDSVGGAPTAGSEAGVPQGPTGAGADPESPAPSGGNGSGADAADGSPEAAASDAGTPSDVDPNDPPRAPQPCGVDLDADNGRVVPQLGTLPQPQAFEGNPEQNGDFGILEEPISVPLQARVVEGAGYRIEQTAGSLEGRVYLPSSDGDAPAPGPFALVLLLPGFQASYAQYAHFSKHFASHGFVAVGIDTRSDAATASHDTEAAEVVSTLDFLLSSAFKHWARIDATKVAVAGHSKGGKLAHFAAALDNRIDQVIAWDPQNGGGPPCFVDAAACHGFPVAPNCGAEMAGEPGAEGILQYMRAATLVLGVPPDPFITPDPEHNAEHFYRGAPSPAAFVRFDDGHVAWLEPPLGNADIIRVSKAVQVATLRSRFANETGLDRYLPGGAYLDDATGVSAVFTK